MGEEEDASVGFVGLEGNAREGASILRLRAFANATASGMCSVRGPL